ncbi:MAG: 2-oxoacid:acceptor oxidoreductase subunit alpha [Patescibacteria group bacterium]|nr:2-oxoacid:acceptor oxidoreductase subunit alpha [Patescibacteria group bacterium]
MKKDYSILIGGEAGQGSRKAGLIIAKVFNDLGYRIFIYDDYQSLVRGGHSFSQIRASEDNVFSHRKKIDFLLALDDKTIKKHRNNLTSKGIIIYNSDKVQLKEGIGIPIETICRELKGISLMANTALLAGFLKTIGIDWKVLEKILRREIDKEIVLNLKIARKVYQETNELIKIKRINRKPLPLLTGNEAVSLGAVRAGLNIYVSYPMTPATGILNYLAKHKRDFNINVFQLENEISVINAAIAGAYTGKRTMVGTSGGGFALMTEALSLAGQAEVPILIVESQRTGPASGVPTYSGQSDLWFALGAGHGDFLRFVFAPSDANESFYWAGELLNLSWKYQTPSILLIDKQISESTFQFNEKLLNKLKCKKALLWNKKGKYQRYKITKKGISPLGFPGEKNIISKVNSYEHNEDGITVEDENLVKKMQLKRLRKFQSMKNEIDKMEAVKIYGNKKSKSAIICWGSTVGPARETAEKLKIKLIQPIVIQPFPENQLKRNLKGVEKLISIEANSLGQLEKVLNCYGIKPDNRILRYDSRPFLPEELTESLKNIFSSK